ncbi:hypothetical protein LFM56_01360 [Cellulomonas iranensis]|uniref:beta strand repeat-containing protein n=1 Tax=Cellulomonas iranensis TaxID=76862 RepID=UPI001CF414B0|nr:immunoglobulin domain-containing protein [Cellulomonas iranensis]UCN15006.1 hypothetical protein LFM56_01360 [Cellulomonas iranensis]
MPPGQSALPRPVAAALGLFVVFAPTLVAPPAQAAPVALVVDTTVDAPLVAGCDDGAAGTSLREALCAAGAHDASVVAVPAGTYALTAGALTVDPGRAVDVTLRGAGAATTTIDARGASRVLDVDASLTGGVRLTVEGVTLTRGLGGEAGGGAVLAGTGDPGAADALTLRDCAVTDSVNAPPGTATPADVGGAVSMTGGALLVERCTFSGNTADGASGGAIGYTGVGGGDDAVEIVDATFTGNAVRGEGSASDLGGAVDVRWGTPTTTIIGSRFEGNTLATGARAARGSAVRVVAGTAELVGVAVVGNTATGAAGSTAAVDLAGGTVTDSRFAGNVTDVAGTTSRAGLAGATSAVRSWWGCVDPAGAGCDAAGGATTTPWATVATTLDPTAADAGTTVTARVALALSDGTAPGAALLRAVAGAPVTWAGATFAPADPALAADGTASARFVATAPGTVTSTVDGAATTAELTVTAPPTITQQPVDVTALEGGDATFDAAASGAPAPTLQWQRRAGTTGTWADVPGATGTTLVLTGVTPAADGTQVRVVATGSGPAATSTPATLTVTWGPDAVVGPQDVADVAGADVTFTASAEGSPAPTVQWQTSSDGTSWQDVPGATDATWTRTLTTEDQGLHVRAAVTGASGTTTSAPARVTVEAAPAITGQPADATVREGDLPRFEVAVTGTPAPDVRWQTRAAGASTWSAAGDGPELVLDEATAADDGTRVRAVVTNPRGTVTSAEATLHVQHGPGFTQQPQAVTVDAGDDATFTAAAAGFPAPTLQWQTSTDGTSWASAPGATGGTWTRTVTAADDGVRVRALATGFAGTVASDAVLLTVRHAPTVTDPAPLTVDVGDDASFTVAVTGNPAPGVRWERRAPGASTWTTAGTGPTLVLPATTSAEDGTRVRAVATNALGTVTSAAATLEVRHAPAFTAQPQDATGLAGDVVTFTAAATGNPAPDVRWQRSTDGTAWDDVPDATGPSYARTLTDADHGLLVRAVAGNALATVGSDPATVAVDAPPVVVTPPADVTVDAGTDATFTVTVAGRPTPAVTWQSSSDGTTWDDVAGAVGTTLVVPGDPAADGTRYRAVATSSRGSVTSADAALRVLVAPTVSDPLDVATAPGAQVAFTVEVTGRPVPDVTWEATSDGTTWAAVGTGTTLRLTPTLADDGLRVRAVATATLVAGPVSVTSAEAELVVAAAPEVVDGPGPVTRLTTGVPATLAWTVLGADATATWDVSRDGGATWQPVPLTWATSARPAGGAAARAAGPAVRTEHVLTLTPSVADEGALVRLTVSTVGGTATASTVLDVVGVDTPGGGTPGGGTPGGGSPGGGTPGTGAPGTGAGTAPAGAGPGTAGTTPTASGLPRTGLAPLPLLALAALVASAGVAGVAAATRRRRGA